LTIGIGADACECLLAPARDNFSSHPHLVNTACVLWIGKTTVCRIFSCQRSIRGKYRPAELTGAAGRFPPDPLARSLAGPQRPTPFARPKSSHRPGPGNSRDRLAGRSRGVSRVRRRPAPLGSLTRGAPKPTPIARPQIHQLGWTW
jgi:hypothetical protein